MASSRQDPLRVPDEYRDLVSRYAEQFNIPMEIAASLFQQESQWDPQAQAKTSSAIGLGQLTRGVYEGEYGLTRDQALSPEENIRASLGYLRKQTDQFGGDIHKGLAAYHHGAGNIRAGKLHPEGNPYFADDIVSRADSGSTAHPLAAPKASSAPQVSSVPPLESVSTGRMASLAAAAPAAFTSAPAVSTSTTPAAAGLGDLNWRNAVTDPLATSKAMGRSVGRKSLEAVKSNPGAAIHTGGALLAGLAGKWAEDVAWKDEKDWADRMSDSLAADPSKAGKGLSEGATAINTRSFRSLSEGTLQSGIASLKAAQAKGNLSAAADATVVGKAVQAVEAITARVDGLEKTLGANQGRLVGHAQLAKSEAIRNASNYSSAISQTFSATAAQRAAEAGQKWQDAIGGITEMAAFIATGGQSGWITALEKQAEKQALSMGVDYLAGG